MFVRLSKTVNSNMEVYPNNNKVNIHTKSIGNVKSTDFSMCVHNGTHIDFPSHYIPNGKTSSDYNINELIFTKIDIPFIEEVQFGGLLLLRKQEHPINVEDAKWIVKSGYSAVGVDTISIADPTQQLMGDKVHEILLGNNVIIIEDMDFTHLTKIPDRILVIPMFINEVEGTPCTVLAEYV